MAGGTTYKFTLTATNSHGAADQASITVLVGRAPTNGTVSVNPTNGTALVTKFAISTEGWTDDAASLPLSYQFLFVDASSVAVSLGESSEMTNLTDMRLTVGPLTSPAARGTASP